MEYEKIQMKEVFKRNGIISSDLSDDCQLFELYGYLKCLMTIMEENLLNNFKDKNDY